MLDARKLSFRGQSRHRALHLLQRSLPILFQQNLQPLIHQSLIHSQTRYQVLPQPSHRLSKHLPLLRLIHLLLFRISLRPKVSVQSLTSDSESRRDTESFRCRNDRDRIALHDLIIIAPMAKLPFLALLEGEPLASFL